VGAPASRIPSKERFLHNIVKAAATITKPPFQRFLDQHREPVLAFLRALVGPVEADDCFQETFIAAMRGYDRMDGRHPRAWVMTIARSKAIDHHRARSRRPEPSDDVGESEAPAGDAGSLGDLDGEVWSAVAALSQTQREAVALRYAADLPYREIGAALECSEDAARRRVADGLAALRKTLDTQEARR
jgi:RNA polymerase sigma factor (sigma-70 family)